MNLKKKFPTTMLHYTIVEKGYSKPKLAYYSSRICQFYWFRLLNHSIFFNDINHFSDSYKFTAHSSFLELHLVFKPTKIFRSYSSYVMLRCSFFLANFTNTYSLFPKVVLQNSISSWTPEISWLIVCNISVSLS